MATATKTTRSTKPTSIAQIIKPAKAQLHHREPLRKTLAKRDAAFRRGEYEILGQLMLLRTERGDIDYRQNGPYLARLTGTRRQELVLMNEWKGFPDMVSLLNERCPDCLAPCTSCDATGKRLCMGMNCGGEGRMILGWEACDADGCAKQTGKAKFDCAKCQGQGRTVGQTAECPQCKGEKFVTCPLCAGSGQMATGREGGKSRDDDSAKTCGTCAGTGRKLLAEPQDWKEFELGELEGFTVLGPISSFVMRADVCRDKDRGLEMGEIYADEFGNVAALLVKNPAVTGQSQYWFGGALELHKM